MMEIKDSTRIAELFYLFRNATPWIILEYLSQKGTARRVDIIKHIKLFDSRNSTNWLFDYFVRTLKKYQLITQKDGEYGNASFYTITTMGRDYFHLFRGFSEKYDKTLTELEVYDFD